MRVNNNLIKRLLVNILPWKYTGIVFQLITRNLADKRKFRKTKVGDNTYLDPSVQIIGWQNVEIGDNTVLSEGTWLNVNFRDAPEKKIIIGNNCHIGRRNFFSSGPRILVKDYCMTSVDCHFLGCGHVIVDPMVPYVVSGPSSGDVIEIGVNCWLATAVTILEGVTVGHGSIIGARTTVTRSIPPFSIAYGNPCIVKKRFDFGSNRWIPVDEWTKEMELLIPVEDDYLNVLNRNNHPIQPSLIASGCYFGWLK